MFWDEIVPEDVLDDGQLRIADINFNEWLIFDFQMDATCGDTLIDDYIEVNKNLSAADLKILEMMNDAVISLYEVKEVKLDQGILVNDLLLSNCVQCQSIF